MSLNIEVNLSEKHLHNFKTHNKETGDKSHSGSMTDRVEAYKRLNRVVSILQTLEALPCSVQAFLSYENGTMHGDIVVTAFTAEAKNLAWQLLRELDGAHPRSRSLTAQISFSQEVYEKTN